MIREKQITIIRMKIKIDTKIKLKKNISEKKNAQNKKKIPETKLNFYLTKIVFDD